jgi:CRISPR-associated protein Cmr5
MSRLDIDQKRAKYAFEKASAGMKAEGKKYGSQIESLSMMIHNSGLRNTLAFAYAKGYLKDNKEWKLVFEHLTNWLKNEPTDFFTNLKSKTRAEDILKEIIELGDYEYRFATQETVALVNWLRKLVKGEDKQPKKEKGGKDE